MKSIGERLRESIEKRQIVYTDLAKKIGKRKQHIYQLLETPNPGVISVLELMKHAGISPNEIFGHDYFEHILNEPFEMYSTEVMTDVPIVPAVVAAGSPQYLENADYRQQLATISIPRSILPQRDCILVQVAGNSMEPTLSDGDWVIIRKIDSNLALRLGRLYVVVSPEGATVKRLHSFEKGILNLTSDNPDHPPAQVKQISQLWEVILTWRWQM